MSVRPDLDGEIARLNEEIAVKRAEAARLRAGVSGGVATAPRPEVTPLAAPVAPVPAPTPAAAAEHAPEGRPIPELLLETLTPEARPIVLRAGYDALAALGGPEPIRFPPAIAGGSHEAAKGPTAAIAALETLRARGATHIVLSPGSEEWLGETQGFMVHLTNRYRRLAGADGWAVHSLAFDPDSERPWTHHLSEILEEYSARYQPQFAALDWSTDLGLAGRRWPGCTVFRPLNDGDNLPYLSDSVELVALDRGASPAAVAEARRVAGTAVLRPSEPQGPTNWFEVEWLREPERRRPETSIVIPTYNAATMLDQCMRAIRETVSGAIPVEVVVVDDASSDDTEAVLERWKQRLTKLTVVRNPENKGFLESCNNGAAAASGEVLVFLNNDTIPLPGWLGPLVETLVERADVGAVGGKLIYPDGTLQEAGGVIFSNGSGANFGRGDPNPDAPLYSFPRDVHYCSGALIATWAEHFARMGGFDPHFSPGYYEETDLCFRLRREGARVLFEPESAIVHLEGGTAGTDEASGMKRYQAINREKFVERWAAELASCPSAPRHYDELTWHALAHAAEHGDTGG
jgi:GT2 family glycosyltransferase